MKPVVIELYPEHKVAPPEAVLWLAVIERAMLDAVYPTQELSMKHKMELFHFFYDEEPRPYNLVYICNNMFDYPDAPAVIRARLKKLITKENEGDMLVRSKRYKGYY